MSPRAYPFAVFALCLVLAACSQEPAPSPAPTTTSAESRFRLSATIQEIMLAQVDPAADMLWESVQTITTAKGIEEIRPRTDAEWLGVRHNALVLLEATNLLAMEGRLVAPPGKAVADEGIPGILNTKQIQTAIDSDHATFVKFAHALHDAGSMALAAIDAKDAEALLMAGDDIDTACENCHLRFWYPDAPKRP